MLNRDLDPAVLNLAETLGIDIFPSRWTNLDMDYSCPDWAVPCKHLAAVIYLLSREIDGNPFLVFSPRGIDLVEALQARDLLIKADGSPPELIELLRTDADPVPAEDRQEHHQRSAGQDRAGYCTLTPGQTALYQSVVQEGLSVIVTASRTPPSARSWCCR